MIDVAEHFRLTPDAVRAMSMDDFMLCLARTYERTPPAGSA